MTTNDLMTEAPVTHKTAQTRRIGAGGVRLAYRRFGARGVTPLVMLQYFRGNLDNWDPALTDALAAEREVILVAYPACVWRPSARPGDVPRSG